MESNSRVVAALALASTILLLSACGGRSKEEPQTTAPAQATESAVTSTATNQMLQSMQMQINNLQQQMNQLQQQVNQLQTQ